MIFALAVALAVSFDPWTPITFDTNWQPAVPTDTWPVMDPTVALKIDHNIPSAATAVEVCAGMYGDVWVRIHNTDTVSHMVTGSESVRFPAYFDSDGITTWWTGNGSGDFASIIVPAGETRDIRLQFGAPLELCLDDWWALDWWKEKQWLHFGFICYYPVLTQIDGNSVDPQDQDTWHNVDVWVVDSYEEHAAPPRCRFVGVATGS